MMTRKLIAAALMATFGASHAVALENLPGNTDLPSPPAVLEALAKQGDVGGVYHVQDFFKSPEVSSYQISPDGKYLVWRQRNENGKRDLWIREINSDKLRLLLAEGDDVIRGYSWVNDHQLVYMQDKGGNENYHIYRINADGSDAKDLTPFDGVRAMISNVLHDDKDHIIIVMNKENPELFTPYRLDLNNGDLEKLYDNPPSEEPIDDFLFDKDGKLRVITRIVQGQDTDLYYLIDGKFQKIKHIPFGEVFSVLGFDYKSDNPNAAYVLSNEESDKANIYRYDLKTGKVLDTVFTNDTYDAGGISRSRKRGYELDTIFYNDDKPQTIAKSETFKKWEADLQKQLGTNQNIDIIDADDDEKTFIVLVSSDREPGVFYLYQPENQRLEKLTSIHPHLKREDMSEMTPITFQSRDGMTIHGYFSRPAHIPQDQKVPVIVYVHGGPQGVRDSWGFDPQVQLFTSHGYGVLQVNFRISGGYGKQFFNAGLGQVGRKTMDDVEDGIDYIIKKGWADPQKIAIYGGSHGGFAVLRGLVKTPDLYACGVDYVGVSNLYTFMKTIPAYWEPVRNMLYTIWYNPDDPAQKAIMDEVSPLQNADKITKPLFVVQGANDPRVNINEADQIVSNLRNRGIDVPYMVKYDEGHGFAKEANRLDMQRSMMGFLHQCLQSKKED